MPEPTGADVTVTVCAYNAAETLPATLASIAAQTEPPGAVVVVDDASTDDTASVAKRWSSHLPIDLIVHDTNRGIGRSRQSAQERCATELIALLDADDLWTPDHLETMLATYAEHGGIVVARELLWVRGTGLAPAAGPEREVPAPDRQLRALLQADFLPIGTVFAREDLVAAGGFRAVPAEDWDLWIRMVRNGVRVTRAGHPTYLYRIHHASSSFGDNYASTNVGLLERALGEARSARERRWARSGLRKARAHESLTRAYSAAASGDTRRARTLAGRALRGRPRTAARGAFMLALPGRGARIHDDRLHDIDDWLDQ